MMILLDGFAGSGKSYSVSRWIEENLNSGFDCYSNVVIDESKYKIRKRGKVGTLYYWSKIEELKYIFHGVVFIDESADLFDQWTKLDKDLTKKFRHHRHDKLDIVATALHSSSINKDFRIMVQKQINVSCIHFKKRPLLFIYKDYNMKKLDTLDEETKTTSLHLPRMRYLKCYDTYELLNRENLEGKYKFTTMAEKLRPKNFGDDSDRPSDRTDDQKR